MKRGEIWWAEMGGLAGKRPVVLLSRDESYILRSLVIVAPVTTRIRDIPSEVTLSTVDGMAKTCVVNLDTISTVKKQALINRISVLNPEKLKEMDIALHFALGLTCYS
jgi:mRNA interferase MazF